MAVLGFRPGDPTGYGRLITEGDALVAIREHADASEAERAITLVQCRPDGALPASMRWKFWSRSATTIARSEFYLTDAVAIARRMGLKTVATRSEEDEVSGINSKAQLAAAEARSSSGCARQRSTPASRWWRRRPCFLAADTKLGRDVTIEPYVVFGPGVTVEDGATIRSFSHLHGAHVGKNAIVGPYARLRPGAKLGEKVHVGNFVEVKEATLEAGAKANHLTYIGDARVGEGANIGAGTITCNYDGVAKHRTDIGKGAFIGSNSALVAPVKIGDGAYVGSGSVITKDVPADALALERAQQTIKEGWAKRLRSLKAAGKKKEQKVRLTGAIDAVTM